MDAISLIGLVASVFGIIQFVVRAYGIFKKKFGTDIRTFALRCRRRDIRSEPRFIEGSYRKTVACRRSLYFDIDIVSALR